MRRKGEDCMADDFYQAPGRPEDPTKDYIVHATAMGGQVRAVAIRSTQLVQKMQQIHKMSPVAAVALGRFMTGSLLLASNLKGDNVTQTTILRCDGPLKGMTAVCDSNGHVRAYAQEPVVENFYHRPGKLNIAAAVGNGSLSVIRESGKGEPYSGSVELVSGEIAEDFTYYLASSEQTPSIVSLGVLIENGQIRAAGGFLIQLMPGAVEETVQYLEKRTEGAFPDITFLLTEGLNPEHIIDMFIGQEDISFLSAREVEYRCSCSRDRMQRNLITLGAKELMELAEDPQGIRLECHFCDQVYAFSQEEIQDLAASV